MSQPALGNYLWGSLLVRTTRQASVRGAGGRAFLKAVIDHEATWEDARQFIAIATFHHETTHLLQDVTTGCGMWDFSVILNYLRSVNYWKLLARKREDYFREISRIADGLKRELTRCGLILPEGLTPARQPKLFAQLPHPDAALPSQQLSIEAILEAEAMIHTEALLEQLKMPELSRQIMEDHRELYDIGVATGKYSFAYQQIFQLMSGYGELPPGYNLHRLAKPVFLLLADIALAFPPASLMDGADASWVIWHPVVKFFALMKAFNALSPEDFQQVLVYLMSNATDSEKAEAILCRHTPYAQLPRRRIYEAWLKWLEENEVPPLQTAFALRKQAVATYLQHLAKTVYWRTEWFRGTAEIPWLSLTPMGLNWMGAAQRNTIEESEDVLNEQLSCLLSYNRERELLFAFAGVRPFVCVVGETRLCPAQVTTCVSGDVPKDGVAAIPSHEHCSVWNMALRRDWMRTFKLPTPNRSKDPVPVLKNPSFNFDHIAKTG